MSRNSTCGEYLAAILLVGSLIGCGELVQVRVGADRRHSPSGTFIGAAVRVCVPGRPKLQLQHAHFFLGLAVVTGSISGVGRYSPSP